MKHRMSLIVYNGMDSKDVYRKDWDLPDITAEEFDVNKHTGKLFMYPDGALPTPNGMYVWRYCRPENEEEEKKLIEMGKWGSPDKEHNNPKK